MGSKCTLPALGCLGLHLSLSTYPSSPGSGSLSPVLQRQGYTGGRLPAPVELVPSAPPEGLGTFPSTSRTHTATGHQPGSGFPSQPLHFQASCMDTIEVGYTEVISSNFSGLGFLKGNLPLTYDQKQFFFCIFGGLQAKNAENAFIF